MKEKRIIKKVNRREELQRTKIEKRHRKRELER